MSEFLSRKYGLSHREREVVWAMMVKPVCSRNHLSEVIWPDPDDMPDFWHNCVNKTVYHIKKKIGKHGWSVKYMRSYGYRLIRQV